MVRVSMFLLAAAVIVAPIVTPTSAQTVKPAPKCANGLPEWANEAFAGRRGSPAYRCDPAPAAPAAAPKARPAATQARAKQAPTTAAEPVAKKEAAAPAAVTAEPSKPTEQAAKSAEPATKVGTKPLCRRYLASTGQTVEVPCS